METGEQCESSKMDVPSSSKDLSKTLPEDAFNNFLQGKRHMLVQDYTYAVQSLATACEMYVKHFGELAIECGEVYFLYGKALFRLSQQQAGVLGGALNEGSNEESEESENDSGSKENESEKNSDAEGIEEQPETNENDEKEPSESTDSPQAVADEGNSESVPKEETPEEKSKEVPQASESQEDKTDASGGGPSGDKEENQESEEDDLELAWNTLETAKSIFKKQNTIESQLKVAEILQLLAEISMESDNNAAAIADLKECLEIQKKHLKADDRILAETCYQMGLALMLDKCYPKALENFRTTKQILQLRLDNLKNTPVNESAGSFASADKDIEITDLENILLDIQEKIEDTEELIRNGEKESKEAFDTFKVESPIKETEGIKPVTNITHLLKRKKPEDANQDVESKRVKVCNTSVPNGDSTVSDAPNPEG